MLFLIVKVDNFGFTNDLGPINRFLEAFSNGQGDIGAYSLVHVAVDLFTLLAFD
jgi:hypothetical protein